MQGELIDSAVGCVPADGHGCRLPDGHGRPALNPEEVVSLASFHERGQGLPVRPFFCRLLHYYKIELHHLFPGRIFHVATFITMCEAFLGIQPHFDLWKYFFIAHTAATTKDGKLLPVASSSSYGMGGQDSTSACRF
jgi:hypothetical protein